MNLEDLLLRHGAIDEGQLSRAHEEQNKWGGDLGRILVDLGFINEELLVRAQAHQLGIPAVNPAAHPLEPELVRALPVQICERFGIIAVQIDEATRRLRVATNDPANAANLAQIGEVSGWHVEAAAATATSIELAIRRNYYGEPALGQVRGIPADGAVRGIPPPVGGAEQLKQHDAALDEAARSEAAEETGPDQAALLERAAAEDAAAAEIAAAAAAVEEEQAHVEPAPALRARAEPPPPEPLPREPLPRELPRRHAGAMTELDAITARVEQLERMLSNPQFAAILARLERLEQLAETEGQALRIIGAVLVEQGLITREQFVRRMKSGQ